jgi:hypothetical protein
MPVTTLKTGTNCRLVSTEIDKQAVAVILEADYI